jgi:putative FmdB family regulatory protein
VPIYEYRCTNGHQFDVLQSFSDPPLESCEECGAPVHKVLSAPAVHFKGSGFYTTDYGRGKGARTEGGSNGSDGSSGGSESGGSSESSKSGDKVGSSSSGDSGSKGSSGGSGSGSSSGSGSGSGSSKSD